MRRSGRLEERCSEECLSDKVPVNLYVKFVCTVNYDKIRFFRMRWKRCEAKFRRIEGGEEEVVGVRIRYETVRIMMYSSVEHKAVAKDRKWMVTGQGTSLDIARADSTPADAVVKKSDES